MTRIVHKEVLGPGINMMVLETPEVARKAQPGQFVVVRTDEGGERIPMTIADMDPARGTVTIVVQEAGRSTCELGALGAGQSVADLVGPLGRPSLIKRFGTVASVGGGIGVAATFPIARALAQAGNRVISILGTRSKAYLFWEDKTREFSDVHVTTDDGSYGRKGFVTDELAALIKHGTRFDYALAIGPTVMMRAVARLTREYNIPTTVSLNPIMVDATGMCGGCRVTIGGHVRFACVDGPEFDAHQVDFDELLARQKAYSEEEEKAMQSWKSRHPEWACKLANVKP